MIELAPSVSHRPNRPLREAGKLRPRVTANIDVRRTTHDAVVYGPDRLEQHGKEEPVRDLFLAVLVWP